jgi:serine/threonine protein kinase
MLQTKQVLQGRYQLQKQLGNNPGRQTWLATDIKTSPAETVIVKLLAFSPQMQWEEFKLFEREAQVLKSLNHLRIPKYRNYFSLDQHTGDGLCWFALVQDSIPGHSLQQLLDEGKRFTQEQVRSIATQVLEILIYLHGLNPPVLHRDIKPSNLIWREDVETRNFASVHLVDFGAVADPTTVEGATFTVVGTAGYAPLEQFYGKTVPASDLYALGATLIHLLTGTSPADLPQSKLRIQFRDRVSLDPSFVRWIESLTEPDLDHRFSSASQALEALKTGNSRCSRRGNRFPHLCSKTVLEPFNSHGSSMM